MSFSFGAMLSGKSICIQISRPPGEGALALLEDLDHPSEETSFGEEALRPLRSGHGVPAPEFQLSRVHLLTGSRAKTFNQGNKMEEEVSWPKLITYFG